MSEETPQTHEPIWDEIERRAEEILTSVTSMSSEELDALFDGIRPKALPEQRVYEIAHAVSSASRSEGEVPPTHVDSVLSSVAAPQMLLDFASLPRSTGRVLLIDADPQRLAMRRSLFAAANLPLVSVATLFEGLKRLRSDQFGIVVIDYQASTSEEEEALQSFQAWNTQLPVINVGAWRGLVNAQDRRFTRDLIRTIARLFGKSVPRRLRERKPVLRARTESEEGKGTFFGAG